MIRNNLSIAECKKAIEKINNHIDSGCKNKAHCKELKEGLSNRLYYLRDQMINDLFEK